MTISERPFRPLTPQSTRGQVLALTATETLNIHDPRSMRREWALRVALQAARAQETPSQRQLEEELLAQAAPVVVSPMVPLTLPELLAQAAPPVASPTIPWTLPEELPPPPAGLMVPAEMAGLLLDRPLSLQRARERLATLQAWISWVPRSTMLRLLALMMMRTLVRQRVLRESFLPLVERVEALLETTEVRLRGLLEWRLMLGVIGPTRRARRLTVTPAVTAQLMTRLAAAMMARELERRATTMPLPLPPM